jgi:hypothetical protein
MGSNPGQETVAAIERTIPTGQRQRERGAWSAAVVLTILLHAVVLTGLWVLRPFSPDLVQAKTPEPLQLVFADAAKPSDQPTFFTEQPQDMADAKPDKADFLSNIDSRARDAAAGTGNLPRLDGSVDDPQVAMVPGEAEPRAAAPAPAPDSRERPDVPTKDGVSLEPRPREPQPMFPLSDPKSLLVRPGNSDIAQEAMNTPDGGTPLDGGITLNTVAWDYAPWLQRFRRDFLRDWRAPYAYYMGLIHGWHVLELEIAPSGRLLRMDLLDQNGSDTLVQTSEHTFKALAPYQPLPDSFPEKSLILRIKLVYPQVPQRTR